MAQEMFKGLDKKGKKKADIKKGKAFTLHHCWAELEHDEKWKNRELYEVPSRKQKASIDVGDSSDDDTPHSIAKTKRPDGRKCAKELLKGKKAGDDDISNHFNALMETGKEIAEERKALKMKEIEELKETEQRKAAVEEIGMVLNEEAIHTYVGGTLTVLAGRDAVKNIDGWTFPGGTTKGTGAANADTMWAHVWVTD